MERDIQRKTKQGSVNVNCSSCERGKHNIKATDLTLIIDSAERYATRYRFTCPENEVAVIKRCPESKLGALANLDTLTVVFCSDIPQSDVDNWHRIVAQNGEVTDDEEIDFGLLTIDQFNEMYGDFLKNE